MVLNLLKASGVQKANMALKESLVIKAHLPTSLDLQALGVLSDLKQIHPQDLMDLMVEEVRQVITFQGARVPQDPLEIQEWGHLVVQDQVDHADQLVPGLVRGDSKDLRA